MTLVKGAIVGVDLMNPLASVIVFQYNPQQLSRSLTARTAGQDGARGEVLRLAGAPTETISISELSLDAADQLDKGDLIAATMGIYPQLAALEMLLYPKSLTVIANTALLLAGAIEIVQPEAPLTLFVWGVKRVLPVRISSLTINELQYDANLNPILANISLEMAVLSYNDFSATHTGYYMFLAHQGIKEVMAVMGSVSNIAATAAAPIDAQIGI